MFNRYSLVAGAIVGSYCQLRFHQQHEGRRPLQWQVANRGFSFPTAHCEAVKDVRSSNIQVQAADSNDEAECKKNQDIDGTTKNSIKPGFKDRKIMEYENRIRAFSTPDKIFRYFATYKYVYENGESEIFMTPQDFLRSITPGQKQPDRLGLDKFKTKRVTAANSAVNRATAASSSSSGTATVEDRSSVFDALGECGLISFSDYVFMLTVLATPQRNFEIAFRMFDLNGDGCVDVDEFFQVTTTARSQTTVGMRHRDHKNTGNVVKSFRDSKSALVSYFFGPTGRERKLTVDKFIEFQKQLQEDVLYLEFCKYITDEESAKIREDKFVQMLLTYSGLNSKKQKHMLKRVRKYFAEEKSVGVTFEETKSFFLFIKQINDVDLAFDFYRVVGADIDKETMKKSESLLLLSSPVAKTVASQELSHHVIDIVYTAFDEDGNGTLSDKEFIAIMKRRLMRGLEKPKDTGFFRLIDATWKCAKETSWRYPWSDE